MRNSLLQGSKEKTLNNLNWVISLVVFALVILMHRYKINMSVDFSFLPLVYSILNLLTAGILFFAYRAIRFEKSIGKHRKLMISAIVTSGLFLLLYVIYHFTTEETRYCHTGPIRILYFTLLITHIITAALILPFILLTLTKALVNQFEKHKRIARYVFPVWMFVALSGPICYLMLYNCY